MDAGGRGGRRGGSRGRGQGGDQRRQGPGEPEGRRPDRRNQGRGRAAEAGWAADQQRQGPREQEGRRPDPRNQGRGRGAEPGRNLPLPSGAAPRGRGGYYGAQQPSQQFEPGTSSQPAFQAPSPRGGYQPAPRGWGAGGYRPRPPAPATAPAPETEARPVPVAPVREMAEMAISGDPGPSRSVAAGPSSSAGESSGGTLTPVCRPDGGGKVATGTVRILANHFLAQFNPSQKIFHYDVDITQNGGSGSSKKRGRVSKADAQAIKQKLLAENRDVFGNAMPVYDLEKNLYSPVPLPDAKYTVKLSKGEEGKVKEYTVALQRVNVLDGRRLAEFLDRANTNHVKIQQEFIQALDLVLREHPSTNRLIVGRSLYPRQPDRDGFLGGGVIASRGFSQSLRPTAQGMALNVDFSVVAFHQPIPVLDYLWENCRVDCKETQQLSAKERRDAENALKGLKVRVTHRLTSQKYVVRKFTKQITKHLTFDLGEEGGPKETVSIVKYFKERYGRRIQFELLPCLDVSKSPERTNYIPMEFCEILEGQRYPRDDLSGNQAKALHRIACPRVTDRMRLINEIMSKPDGPIGGPYAGRFQITVSTNMTEVTGRVLGAPQLRLGNGGQVREVTPRADDRQWNLLKSHVFDGRAIDKWGLVNFSWEDPSRRREMGEMVQNFSNMLVGRCGELGIRMNPQPVVCIFEQMRKFSNVGELRQSLMGANVRAKGQLQILICIMEGKDPGYKVLKLICETEIGLLTQCCLFEHVKECWNDVKKGSQYLANLALKINAKVGGSNAALLQSLSRQLPRFGQSHVAYFGADVNHPGSRDGRSPSIAAVVASINWPWCNRYVTIIRSQETRKEHILELGQMVKELLDEYLKVNHQLPQIILFFRDGVSEGQFNMVLNEELVALKNAFAEFKDYNPTISFIVAQKRHHTRLFPFDARQATKSGNVPPGTVVDTVIVHPREFDFYLCSHYGLLGTSKPTHYHVLWDENSFASDELQTLINNLCYTFARCTKPVSLVPPVYYADLAAYRGRQYVEGLSLPLSSDTASSSSSSSSVASVPRVHEGVKSDMFFC